MIKTQRIKKDKTVFPEFGKLFILTLPNNTKLTITDLNDRVLKKFSVGMCGFKGSRKSTPLAATNTTSKLLSYIYSRGMKNLTCVFRGMYNGRNGVLQAITNSTIEINIIKIIDLTSIAHNGARRPIRRRT